MEFPFEIKRLASEVESKISEYFPIQQKELVQVGDAKWLLPQKFENTASQIYNFEVRDSDVFICTMPRSGTTWTQEMIWLICNFLDYDMAAKNLLSNRFPFLEYVRANISNQTILILFSYQFAFFGQRCCNQKF